MSDHRHDVVGIGNAIVDVLAHSDDAFLETNQIEKGAMTLIDEARAQEIYSRMGPAVEVSGGSAANTIAGIADLGARTGFIGKVRNDQLGDVFTHDIRAVGVDFDTPKATAGPATARCFILVTPDAQRSMSTYLGACQGLNPDDVPEELIAGAQVTYLEGYLWDPPKAKEAFRKAMITAQGAGRKTALTLSDSFCVDRFRGEFMELIKAGLIDILFANEAEISALFETDFDQAVNAAEGLCEVAAITRSEKGCLILSDGARHEVAAVPTKVEDTTGAGDLFASGFLFGFTSGRSLPDCGQIGCLAAGEVISHFGARPETSLKTLIAEKGL